MTMRNVVAALAIGATVTLAGLSVTGPAKASPVGITSAGALGTIDTFDWGQFVPSHTVFSGPQSVSSNGGSTGTVSSAGNSFEVFNPGVWGGNLSPSTAVLWDGGVGPDITFSLVNPVKGIGAQIDPDFNGAFVAKVTAFDKNGNTLGSFSENGVATSANDGSAIFIGLEDSTADIAKIKFILTSASSSPNDFAIGSVDVTDPPAVPLPTTLFLFASALLGLGVLGRQRAKAKSV